MIRSPRLTASRMYGSARSGDPMASMVSRARLGRAAVQRPGQGADGADHGRGGVGARSR